MSGRGGQLPAGYKLSYINKSGSVAASYTQLTNVGSEIAPKAGRKYAKY